MFTEQLESRRQFSASASLVGDTLTVVCDAGGSDVKVELPQNSSTEIVKVRTGATTYTQIFSCPWSSVKKLQVNGGDGNDRIDVSNAHVADNVLVGGHGSDWIMTGGVKCLAFGDTPVSLNWPAADDNASDTIVDASDGDTSIYGQGGNDFLYSGQAGAWPGIGGTLTMVGGAGNDLLDASYGRFDRTTDAYGGSGNDRFRGEAFRVASFSGGDGTDTADFSGVTAKLTINLDGQRDSGPRDDAKHRFYAIDTDVENAIGGYGDDNITGNSGKNVLWGGAGNDSIYGVGGNDTLYGDDGNDFLNGGNGNDVEHGGNGDDVFSPNDFNSDTLYGEAGSDQYFLQDFSTDYVFDDKLDWVGAKDSNDVIVGLT